MTEQPSCIFCGRVGFVRIEHVVRGAVSSNDYYCGGCNRAWSAPDKSPGVPALRDVKAKHGFVDKV
jgi:hypothetical protein